MGTKGVFDPPSDASFQLDIEGKQVAICFDMTSPTTARVSWNIPVPAAGCENNGQYCGILVTLDTVPASTRTAPINGTKYVGDPTGDRNLHAGDKIGTALVVGAFYEAEQKGSGGEFTTFFDVSGLDSNTAYYVSGYIHDCQNRYFTKGSHAYSLNYGKEDQHDTHGSQKFLLNDDKGVKGTDATGLTVGEFYCFEMTLNDNVMENDFILRSGASNPDFPPTIFSPSDVNLNFTSFFSETVRCTNCEEGVMKHRIFINGASAQTYDDLMDAINVAIAHIWNPISSPVPPDAGSLYYDAVNEKLFQWDGVDHVEIPVIVEPTDPTIVAVGTYWYDTTLKELKRWDGAAWVVQNVISYHQDPTTPGCDDYWFDGTNAYKWNGSTWCELITHAQTKDPSCPPDVVCGSFWYDTINDTLSEWDTDNKKWNETFAIFWPSDPNTPAVGDLWFSDATQQLYEYDGATYVLVADSTTTPPLFVSEEEPTGADDGAYWYMPSTEDFFQYDLGTTTWNSVSVLIWPDEPTNRESCDLWWDSVGDILYTWDSQNLTWDQVASFVQQDTDPSLAPTLEPQDEVWYNSTDGSLSKWIGNAWEPVTFINFPTDPTAPVVDQVWFDTTNQSWFSWDGAAWVAFNPIDSDNDPSSLPVGTYWFNSTSNTLNNWNGVSWVNVAYSTMPFTPSIGFEYFNTTDNVLYVWNGSAYVPATLAAQSYLRPDGHWMIVSSEDGSCSKVRIEDCSEEEAPGNNGLLMALDITVSSDVCTTDGTDGVSGQPSYSEVGVGDDGSPDERRELAYSIRAQLGWPVVEVELTDYQMDTAIEAALEAYRKRSGTAYSRQFFFLDAKPGVSNYYLTDKKTGMNKVVNVLGIYRFNSAFLSTATGAGVYAQVVLQELYNAGSFDLLSYHLIADYIEQLEQLFATRVTYYWDEPTRKLDIYQSFYTPERLLVEVAAERTEQELFTHRYSKAWVEKWALTEAKIMLAEIRGKYGSLPGAGGGISFNAAELRATADAEKLELIQQIEDYIADKPEDYGELTQFVIG